MGVFQIASPRPLVLFGDSHLARLNVGYIAALEAALDGRMIVHNHAIGGANSADLVARAPFEAAAEGPVFVVSVGTNDLAPWKQLPLAEFTANTATLLDRLEGHRSIVVLPPPIDEAAQVRARGELARTNALISEYGRALTDVSNAAGAAIVAPAHLLASGHKCHESDGVHLNAHGCEALLREVANEVRRLLLR